MYGTVLHFIIGAHVTHFIPTVIILLINAPYCILIDLKSKYFENQTILIPKYVFKNIFRC